MIDSAKIQIKLAASLALIFFIATCSTQQAIRDTIRSAAILNNPKLTVVGRKDFEHLPSNLNVRFCEPTKTDYCYLGKLQNQNNSNVQIAEFRLPRNLETGTPSKISIWLSQSSDPSAQAEVYMLSGDISRISLVKAEALLTSATSFDKKPLNLKLTGALDERIGTWAGTFEFKDTNEKGTFSASVN